MTDIKADERVCLTNDLPELGLHRGDTGVVAQLIADFIESTVEPLGAAVPIGGKHLCAIARGVHDTHSVMKVNVMHCAFQSNPDRRREFLLRLEKS